MSSMRLDNLLIQSCKLYTLSSLLSSSIFILLVHKYLILLYILVKYLILLIPYLVILFTCNITYIIYIIQLFKIILDIRLIFLYIIRAF